MQFIQHLLNEFTVLAIGFISYPILTYLLKPVGYKVWDDIKGLWTTVISKEQTAVASVI